MDNEIGLVTKRFQLKDINPDYAKLIAKQYGKDEEDLQFVYKGFEIDPKDMKFSDGECSSIDYITTKEMDRDGEIVEPSGVILDIFKKHPVVVWCHDYKQLPLGKSAWIKSDDKGLISKTIYAVKANPFAKQVYEYRRDGFPLGKSMGFVPLDWKEYNPKINKGLKKRYTKSILLEYSDVPIPSNAGALQIAVSKGLIKKEQVKDLFFIYYDNIDIEEKFIEIEEDDIMSKGIKEICKECGGTEELEKIGEGEFLCKKCSDGKKKKKEIEDDELVMKEKAEDDIEDIEDIDDITLDNIDDITEEELEAIKASLPDIEALAEEFDKEIEAIDENEGNEEDEEDKEIKNLSEDEIIAKYGTPGHSGRKPGSGKKGKALMVKAKRVGEKAARLSSSIPANFTRNPKQGTDEHNMAMGAHFAASRLYGKINTPAAKRLAKSHKNWAKFHSVMKRYYTKKASGKKDFDEIDIVKKIALDKNPSINDIMSDIYTFITKNTIDSSGVVSSVEYRSAYVSDIYPENYPSSGKVVINAFDTKSGKYKLFLCDYTWSKDSVTVANPKEMETSYVAKSITEIAIKAMDGESFKELLSKRGTVEEIIKSLGGEVEMNKEIEEENEFLAEKIRVYSSEIEKLKGIEEELITVKEGRVISGKNKKLIGDCITQMGEAITALKALLEATDVVPKSIDNEEEEDNNFLEVENDDSDDDILSGIEKKDIEEITKKVISDASIKLRYSNINIDEIVNRVEAKVKGRVTA